MPQKVRIALDAMGGDFGASVIVPGAALALMRHTDVEFLLFGDSALIGAQLDAHPALKAVSKVFHADIAISMDEKPSQAYLDKVRDIFGFEPPREHGHHSVESVEAMIGPSVLANCSVT